ncbi:MAG: heat-inducible transcriptional repressor HrcA [Elusimicrobia bacterium]|nr:heat-inducible transcriptional repressor HrcA [Candidatus Liberimonas magnetica]
MRHLDPEVSSDRKKKILQAIIHHYIKTGKPVGSNIITEEYSFGLSPATIRNLMAELEEEGYLSHPHTSAGRLPTDRGYRSYVDSLIELQKLIIDEEDRARQEYHGRIKELSDLLSQTSRALSSLSNYSGFVIAPKIESSTLKYIELAQVSEKQLLVILVTSTGLVKHKIIEAGVPKEQLSRLNTILNENLRDHSVLNVKQEIFNLLEEFEREEKDVIAIAKNLSRHIFDIDTDENMYLEGTSNVLGLPEFHDYESMKCMLSLSEDKDRLMQVLNDKLTEKDISVLIGSETQCKDLQHLSVVSSIYKDGNKPVGILGIIGPKRMEYQKMMALVGAVSKIVNKLLSKVGG